MKKIVLITLTFALLAGMASAESLTLTVDQAVEMAVADNLGLQQSGISLRTKQRAKETRWNAFLPSMSASAGFNGANQLFTDYGITPPSITDPGAIGFTTGINFSLPLNFAAGTGIKKLVADYEGGLLDYEAAQKQLERDVRKQFYLLLGNIQNIAIQEANLELAQNRLVQAQNNFANGLAPELEVLGAEVTVSNLQPVVDGVKAGYESLLLFFKFLIGADLNDSVTLSGDLETGLYDMDSTALINEYMPGRLDLRSLDKQVESLEYSKKTVALNSNSPTLALGYSYGLSGSNTTSAPPLPAGSIDPWTDWSDRGTMSLTLQWKFDGLIPGSKTDVTLSEMQDGIDTLNLAKQMAYESAGIEITNLVNTLATSRKTIEANTSSVELARRNFELTQEAYEVGTRELLDVESAQNDYLAAAQQLLLAKYEYIAGLLDLEYALNARMEDFL